LAAPEFLSATGAAPQSVKWLAVDDDVLAQQTGKNAGASMISGFVLDLLSKWQLPNGATASAHGSLKVASDDAGQLTEQVRTSAHVHDDDHHHGDYGANPHATAIGGEHVLANGVTQVTQVAGDGNVGINSAVISFDNTAPAPSSGNNSPSASASNSSGNNSPSASASNSSGSIKASVSFGNGGATVTLQTPAGLARQSIVPNNTQQAGSIAQLVQIAGNNQAVANQLQLSLQTHQMSGTLLRQLGVLQALQNSALSRR
jgi:hypothetical protein